MNLVFPGWLKFIPNTFDINRFIDLKTGEDNKGKDEKHKEKHKDLAFAAGNSVFLRLPGQVMDFKAIAPAVLAYFGNEFTRQVPTGAGWQVGKKHLVIRCSFLVTDRSDFGYLRGGFCTLAENVIVAFSLYQENNQR